MRSMLRSLALAGFTCFSILASAGGSPRGAPAKPPEVVASVDLKRYQGKWFEIARLPNRFQKDCFNATAEYALKADGKVSVTNRCKSITGENKTVVGTAWSTNAPANTKLKVRFFWPFSGDYWVLALDPNYRWVIVGGPNYKNLWILSREIPLDSALLQKLLDIAAQRGYDTSNLIFDPNIQLR